MKNLPFSIHFLTLLDQMVKAGFVSARKHKTAPLWIYNYTAKAQYERVWNEVTLNCRGLILNDKKEVIARPFPKFFNLEELPEKAIPALPFEVYEKMDGSLGILYWIDNEPFIASRGAFGSEQAEKATALLKNKYQAAIPKLERNKTYLFEIIYPENRIVVNYGNLEELILLAIIETNTGRDLPLENIGFPVVKKYDGIKDLATIQTLEKDNHEGFVVLFENGFRLKVKFEEYKRLHRILTQISEKTIWEWLKNEISIEAELDNVPDEFYNWVKTVVKDLNQQYKAIELQCLQEFKVLESRKTTADYFLTKGTYPPILFRMLDKKDYREQIWNMVKPTQD